MGISYHFFIMVLPLSCRCHTFWVDENAIKFI